MLLTGSPAHADTGGVDGLSVSIGDVALAGYECATAPVTVAADVPAWAGWTIAVVAAPSGTQRLDAIGFQGRGPGADNGSLLICPADSVGTWTATVTTRVLLTRNQFLVGFTVTPLSSSTTITTARSVNSSVKVRGSVLASNGIAGRAALAVSGLRNGKWRRLGHTYARKSGKFRFVTPRKAARVRVSYVGDAVTTSSNAVARVTHR